MAPLLTILVAMDSPRELRRGFAVVLDLSSAARFVGACEVCPVGRKGGFGSLMFSAGLWASGAVIELVAQKLMGTHVAYKQSSGLYVLI